MYYFKQLFYRTIQSPYVPCLAPKKSNLVSQPLILHVDHLLCKWRTKLRFIILSTVFVTFMNEMPQLGSSPFDICKRMRCVWREGGCVSVCWGSWNSIKQMDLLRVSSLLPKKGPNMSLFLANSTQQYAEHISIWLTIHHSLVFYFFLFVLLPLVPAADESRTHLSPFHGHKMNRRNRTGPRCGFQERGGSVNLQREAFTAGITLLGLTARASHGADSRGLGGGRREQRWSTCTVALWGLAKSELCGF